MRACRGPASDNSFNFVVNFGEVFVEVLEAVVIVKAKDGEGGGSSHAQVWTDCVIWVI